MENGPSSVEAMVRDYRDTGGSLGHYLGQKNEFEMSKEQSKLAAKTAYGASN